MSLENIDNKKKKETEIHEKPDSNTGFKMSRRSLFLGAGALAAATASSALHDKVSQIWHALEVQEQEPLIASTIEEMKAHFSNIDQDMDSNFWSSVVTQAFERNNFEENLENVAIVLALILAESGFRSSPRILDEYLTPSEEFVAKQTGAKQRTEGAMEVSVDIVMKKGGLKEEEALAVLRDPNEAVFYGVMHIQELAAIYANIEDLKLRRDCIFADYNAGPFASRNAGLQRALNSFSDTEEQLREDGLLFSKTRKVLVKIFKKHGRSVSERQIIEDFKRQTDKNFETTDVWRAVSRLTDGGIISVPADRPVLGILGYVKFALKGYSDSRAFAEYRQKEYSKIKEILAEKN